MAKKNIGDRLPYAYNVNGICSDSGKIIPNLDCTSILCEEHRTKTNERLITAGKVIGVVATTAELHI